MTGEGGVLLVSMPFGGIFAPSIGLSLLKAELRARDLPVAPVRYFSIRFAELVGQDFYHGLSSEGRPSLEDLAGEWIFSRALFGERAENEEYVEEVLRKRTSPALRARILKARDQTDAFLAWCRDEVVAVRPRLLGLTSMFQQHVASLALARLVKQALPDTCVVLGGANCEDVMGAETVRRFPFVDATVSGEGDLVFPEIAERALEGRSLSGLPGVRTRPGIEAEFAAGRFPPAPLVRDLDALPYPDYSDYFEQFSRSRFGREWQPSVYFETSRGCWWGERMHCTFCGLNPETMGFRSKSAGRARAELDWLTSRHPDSPVEVTDNILDLRYLKDFVPELAARPTGAALFYEVKANLRKEQLRLLRDAGIKSIQPGIESFSDPVLRLMRKGVSALQNIQLLKWCAELGIDPGWNLLWGFPGEPPEEYERMAALVPLLTHLPAPESHGLIRLDRFSPNFHDAERLGFRNVRPLPPYRHIYPLPAEARENLASFFAFDYQDPRDVVGYVRRLQQEMEAWKRGSGKVALFSVDGGDSRLVFDLRPRSRTPFTALRGAERALYEGCDAASDPERLGAQVSKRAGGPLAPASVEERLAPLLERGLLVRDGLRYLALAIPLAEYAPPAPAVERFYELVSALGRKVSGGWIVPAHAAAIVGPRAARRGVRSPRRSRHRPRRLSPSLFSIDARGDVLIRSTRSH